jgi:hypothetical protein
MLIMRLELLRVGDPALSDDTTIAQSDQPGVPGSFPQASKTKSSSSQACLFQLVCSNYTLMQGNELLQSDARFKYLILPPDP